MRSWTAYLLLISAFFFINPTLQAASKSPLGTWTTVDDKSGQKRALVELSEKNGILSGRLVTVYPQAGDTGLCSKCPEPFKDKKIQGLTFLWGLKEQSPGQWAGGYILDPKSGSIYKAKLSVEGNKLLVRGYIGISLLGRTQTWIK